MHPVAVPVLYTYTARAQMTGILFVLGEHVSNSKTEAVNHIKLKIIAFN